ncbi:unnamed protein product [Schistosoma mattheei]|uniref:Uncharacterized protein n=1 Tax=Schistosoma mattheei TaxID=31246 RepID=A0A183Q2C7_9TREM|nr:unnamed protein product [Schistosoma mattheei]
MNPPDFESAYRDPPIDVNPPTTEDIRKVIRQNNIEKAAGSDNKPTETLKSDIEDQSCTGRIAAQRIIFEQSSGWNSSLYINLPDYEKAFAMWIGGFDGNFDTMICLRKL